MLTRLSPSLRRFSSVGQPSTRSSRLFRLLDVYEDFVGLKEVKHAQNAVNDAERAFIASQTKRRARAVDLLTLQSELTRIRLDMEKLSRTDDAYFELFKTQHEFGKREHAALLELKTQDEIERQLFASLQLALRESQDKEKMRVEKTKYWSIIGSVFGALAGAIGATLSNRYRMSEFRSIAEETHAFYHDVIAKQETTIDQFNAKMSEPESYDQLRLLSEQSEERLRSQLNLHTGVLLLSAILIPFIISISINR